MKRLHHLLIIAGSALLLTGCFPFAQFESARTVGKDNGYLGVNGIGYLLNDPTGDLANQNGYVPFGSMELSGGYGLTETSDIRLMVNILGFMYLDYKHMVIGDRQSSFALSSGLGVDANPYLSFSRQSDPYFKIHLPLYLSWHRPNGFYFFLNPKVAYQFVIEGDEVMGTPFVGAYTGGGVFRQNFEFYAGAGPTVPFAFSSNNSDASLFLFQAGIGARYHFH